MDIHLVLNRDAPLRAQLFGALDETPVLVPWADDPARLEAMGKAAESMGRADAADAGAAVVEDSARVSGATGVPSGTETQS